MRLGDAAPDARELLTRLPRLSGRFVDGDTTGGQVLLGGNPGTAALGCRRMTLPSVTRSRKIAAPADAVWGLIATPGHLAECHPFCAANPVDVWPGVGSRDHIEYYSGRVITRRFVAWHGASGYDIEITDATGAVADVTWRLSDDGTGSVLAIGITPRMLDEMPAGLRWAQNRALLRPMLSRYLRSVLAGIEWRVTTGRPVRRNQFGAHRWFSPQR